jgi:hypothetical protein
MSAPSYMSLPKASALPVLRMGFSWTAKQRLLANGIVSALQLAEIASRAPQQLKHLTGISATKARRILEAELGILPDFTRTAVSFDPVPNSGVPTRPPAMLNSIAQRQPDAANLVKEHLSGIKDLPTCVSLCDHMQPVGNQGPFGTCVGWASNALQEYAHGRPMSPGFAYRGAKALDGYPGEGSWLAYAMRHFHRTGHVDERDYPYQAAIRAEPIETLFSKAGKARISGFTSLLMGPQTDHLPKLMRVILAGRLAPGFGPMPIAVSLMLHRSFVSTSTALDGLIPMPFPGEETLGGHAMTVVGYVDAVDPTNPFGVSYFMVRNSWGTTWAGENPFKASGHAMVPDGYFHRSEYVLEACSVFPFPERSRQIYV